ncbi:MAG TPA: acyltransferase [Mycobacteriales bacterium]|nr:acyltransferase [Mycobacteriales bacterium]
MPDPLGRALPAPTARGTWRQWRDDRARRRFLQRSFAYAATPPPPEQWAKFGRAYVVPPARVNRPDLIWLGDGVVILEDVWMSVVPAFDGIVPRLVLGDRVHVGRGCQFSVADEVVIEDDVLIGDFTQIGDTSHPYDARIRAKALYPPQRVRIGRRAVICSHVTILPGVTVGAGAVVDHHTVVTRDVPTGAVVRGNPARVVP